MSKQCPARMNAYGMLNRPLSPQFGPHELSQMSHPSSCGFRPTMRSMAAQIPRRGFPKSVIS